MFEIAEMSSSVIPSAKYSSFGSALILRNGNTATLRLSSLSCVGGNAEGTKVVDRAGSVGIKGFH
jgi:hypothetical protein